MFDPAFYAYSYPDVAHAYGITDATNLTDEQVTKLWLHFWNNGIWCGRACNAEFNASVYASAYGDLQVAYGSDIISYYLHYANTGKMRTVRSQLYLQQLTPVSQSMIQFILFVKE